MKILILARGIPSTEDPQEGCFEWDQAKALKSFGHTPIVMVLDARYRKGSHRWGITHIVKDEIEVYKIYGGTTTIIEHLFSFKLAIWYNNLLIDRLFRYVLKHHSDAKILHAHYNKLIYSAAKINKKYNFPCIGTEHLSDVVKDQLSWKVKYIGDKGYHVNQLITVSNYLQKVIASKFNADSIVCGNVLGEEFANVDVHRDDDYKEKFRYVACGSVIPRKGFDLLIKAASEVNIPRDRWVIEIIGSGQMLDKLRTLANGYGLGDNIIFRGKLNKHQIIESYRQSDCFVLSSRSETFGVVLIEAMACGLPVISTDCGGTKGIVNDDNGVMIPVDDVTALKNAMEYMYRNSSKYNGEIIKDACLKEYSPEAIAKKLTCIYNKVLSVSEK